MIAQITRAGDAKDDPRRVRAGVAFALTTAMDDGHCSLPRQQLLQSGAKPLEVKLALIEIALALAEELTAGEGMPRVTESKR